MLVESGTMTVRELKDALSKVDESLDVRVLVDIDALCASSRSLLTCH